MIRPLTHSLPVGLALPLGAEGFDRTKGAGHFLQEVPDPLAAWPRLLAGLSHGPLETIVPPPTSLPFGPTVLRLGTDGVWEGGIIRPVETRAGPEVWCAGRRGHNRGRPINPLSTKMKELGLSHGELAAHLKGDRWKIIDWLRGRGSLPDGIHLAIEEARSREELLGDIAALYDLSGRRRGTRLIPSKDYWERMHALIARRDPQVRVTGLPTSELSLRRLGISFAELSRALGIEYNWSTPPVTFRLVLAKAVTREEAFDLIGRLYEKRPAFLARKGTYWETLLLLLKRPLPGETTVAASLPESPSGPIEELLRPRLKDRDLYHTEIAEWMGVSSVTINTWVRGDSTPEGFFQAVMKSDLAEDLLGLLYFLYEGTGPDGHIRRNQAYWPLLGHLRALPVSPRLRPRFPSIPRQKKTGPGYWRRLTSLRFSPKRNPEWAERLEFYQTFGEGRGTQAILRGEMDPLVPRSAQPGLRAQLKDRMKELGLIQREIAKILHLSEATVSSWFLGHITFPIRLIPLLFRAKTKAHAIYLLHDLIDRAVEAYRTRHPYWRDAVLLDQELRRVGVDRQKFPPASLHGDLSLEGLLPAIHAAQSADDVLATLDRWQRGRKPRRLSPLPLYQDHPLNSGLRALRARVGISVPDLATLLGIKKGRLFEWERGNVPIPERAHPCVAEAIQAADLTDLTERIARVGQIPSLRRTPERPLTPEEWERVQRILHRNSNFIRSRIRSTLEGFGPVWPAMVDEIYDQVTRDLERALKRYGSNLQPLALLRRIIYSRCIDSIRKVQGITRDQMAHVKVLLALEKQLQREPIADDLIQRFHVDREMAEAYLALYRKCLSLRAPTRWVEFDDTIQTTGEDEGGEDEG